MPVNVISTIKPKNNGTFPVVEDIDILIKSSGKRLSEVVATMATQADIEALQTAINGKASQSDLTALSQIVSNKANQSDLTALSSIVDTKAAASDLATTNAAVATKAEASDLTTATANLQAQIDNIVSGSTADSEVINARVDTDGTTYNTLKARLDANESDTKDDISTLNDRTEKIDGIVYVDKTKFDIGTMGIASTKWTYYSSDYRVRTKPNTTLQFAKGTRLSLSDYTQHKFIISWERTKGVSGDYISSGWLREDFICPIDSNYVMMIARLEDTVEVTDVSDFLDLLSITSSDSMASDVYELKSHIYNPTTGRMPTMYLVDKETMPIYASNFCDSVSDWHDSYKAMSMGSGGITNIRYFNDGMFVTADIEDSYNNPHPASVSFVTADEKAKTSNIPIKVVDATTSGSQKVLCIGDSLTYGGKYLAQYCSMYAEDSLEVEFVGTLGQGTAASPMREGRAQWNTKAYCTKSTFADASNAFMNPTTNKFDFSYYCTTNNIAPDVVCIFLGTNDLTVKVDNAYPTLAESEQYFAEMIASVRTYSANIPIIVWWPPVPCQMNGGGGDSMDKLKRMQVGEMLRKNYVTISGTEFVPVDNVYIMPVYAVIADSDYSISDIAISETETVKSCADSLHPTDTGHKKIATLLHGMLKYLASTGAPVIK